MTSNNSFSLVGRCFGCGEEFTTTKTLKPSQWTDEEYATYYLKKYGIPYKPEYCPKCQQNKEIK